MNKNKSFFRNQSFFLITVIIGLSLLFGIINPRFLSKGNIFAIFQQIAVLGICTMSMTLLLVSGGIDLSIGLYDWPEHSYYLHFSNEWN